jgi:hypothetical protein
MEEIAWRSVKKGTEKAAGILTQCERRSPAVVSVAWHLPCRCTTLVSVLLTCTSRCRA